MASQSLPPSNLTAARVQMLEQQALTREDLLEVVDDFDPEFLVEFERAWTRFVRSKKDDDNPITTIAGQRQERIADLQEQCLDLQKTKDKMEQEFENQIAFLRHGRNASEETYIRQMRRHRAEQQAVQKELTEHLDSAKKIERFQEQTLPWFHFMNELDRLASTFGDNDKDETKNKKTENSNLKIARPSPRAQLLLHSSPIQQNPKKGETAAAVAPSQEQLRAIRIDNALLKTHVSMLHKEVERCELSLDLREQVVGKFLTEHNVWSILSPQQQQQGNAGEGCT